MAARSAHHLGKTRRAVQFDHIRTGLLHDPDGRPQRTVDAFLKRAERNVAADDGSLDAPANRLADDHHFFHRDGQRTRVAPQIGAHCISHRNDVYASAVYDLSDLKIPSHHSNDLSPVPLHLLKGGNAEFGFARLHRAAR